MNTTAVNHFSRRSFLVGCSACAAASLAMAKTAAAQSTLSCGELYPAAKAKVRLVYLHSDPAEEIWPNIGYNFEVRKTELTSQLKAQCPDIDFFPVTIKSQEQMQQMLDRDQDIDGYVCVVLGLGPGLISARALVDSDRPLVLCDDLYGGTGHFLGEYGRACRLGKKVVGVSSSQISDIAQAANQFAAIKKLQHSKMLDVTERAQDQLWGGAKLEDFENVFGTKTVLLRADQLNRAYESADPEQAKAWAEQWISRARNVIEPSKAELIKSGAMYLGLQNLMREHQAQAIAIDCLGLFYSQKMSAYPCMGFFQLNNDGLIGACESDLYSTITMLAMAYLTGKPGFISDPVIDTAKNQVIYAHCVAMNKVHGPEGESNAFDIRDHSEDRKGAAVRSLMPLGETITTLKFRPDRNLCVMHTGKTVENVDLDKACRTKLAATVDGDIETMLKGWDYGWHRVTFFGDYKKTVEDFCTLKGIEVVHEA